MALIDNLKTEYKSTPTSAGNFAAIAAALPKLRLSTLVMLVKNFWRTRKHLKALGGLSDEALNDIGLTYDDLRTLNANSWTQNAGTWLEDKKQNHLRNNRMEAISRARKF